MDSGNKLLLGLGGAVVLLALLSTHLLTRLGNEAEIDRAEEEAARLQAQRDSLKAVTAINDSLQAELRAERSVLEETAARLRDEVETLERQRREEQLTVRRLRTPDDLQARFAETFPEVAASDWGVTEVRNEENDVSLQYLLVPLHFSETFMIDHQNAASFRAQRDTLAKVDSLQQEVVVLQDSVVTLERQSRMAFEAGYDSAFVMYQDLNEAYIEELKRPGFELDLPGLGAVVGAMGVGVVVGTVAN